MKNRNRLLTALCALVAVACLCAEAAAQSAEDKNSFAAVAANGALVRWEVSAPYSSLTLKVSAPDGRVFSREFRAGSAPSFALFDKAGGRLPDGQYIYELRLTPVFAPGVRAALAAARGRGDDAAAATDLRERGLILAQPLVQSGAFTVLKGAVIGGGASEPVSPRQAGKTAPQTALAPNPVPLDQVTPDDLIVQSSLCVGFDCVDGESFGFDTIRLKENSTRIKFEDTSVGSFPSNDWQLTANDSASGGANKFSIEDITGSKVPFTIIAGAPTDSVFVDSTGRLGLRTAAPALDIHANTSNTPAIRLEQNSGGGFTAQTWDIGANEANFFIRDVTGGSRLPFRIRPGAPTSSIDIKADGTVEFQKGIKVAVPGASNTFVDAFTGLNPLGPNYALQFIGAAGTVDEGSASIVDLDNVTGVGLKAGSTGTVTVRFNVPVTPNLTALNSAQSVFKFRYRDSDGAGAGARVRVFFHHTTIDTGADAPASIFDSNTLAATGAAFATVTKCFATGGTPISFATQSSWFEVQVTLTDAAQQANLLLIQFYRDSVCPQ
ncbi:MAG TPA: hypothetical protein VGC87_19965 [Pyrinomonadaceae bacterium]|jgi:hypothetical protein